MSRVNARYASSTSAGEGPHAVKALVYGAYGDPKEVLRVHSHDLAPITPTTIHLQFLASPINPSDINQIEGVYPIRPPFERHLGTTDEVAVAGNEGLAKVIDVGSQVSGFKVGDWVILAKAGFGTWRTHAVAKPEDVVRIDPGCVSVVQAATLSVNNATAYRMLKDFVDLKKGDYVIQNGANSGVGQDVIQIAKAWGINTVNIVRNRPDIEDLKSRLQSLGVPSKDTKTIVITSEELEDKYRSHTHFRELIGDPDANIPLGLNCVSGEIASLMAKHLSRSAHLITYGGMSRRPLKIATSLLIFEDIHFDGFWMAKWKETHSIDEYRRMLDDLINLIREGKLGQFAHEESPWGAELDGQASEDSFWKIFDKAYPDSKGIKQILRMY